MTFVSNKNIAKALSLFLALASGVTPARAADYGEGGFTTSRGSVLGEAAKAVVDRVFGVKGEAADIKYHALELANHSPVNAAVRSALVPGWGQFFNRQPVKGTALFLVVVGGALGAVKLHGDANNNYDSYKAEGLKNGSKFDDYETKRDQAYLLGTAVVFLYGYTVWDAYRNAYNPLWSQNRSVDVALLPEGGAAVEWRQRF